MYRPSRYSEVQKGGKEPYYESFQFEQPPPHFTHLNMVPFFKGSADHVYDNQWNTLYEIYEGEGDVKRGFFKEETEPLFAPKKERQPNFNNEYEHVYDQREIYERVNPERMHNFERPAGTRIFTSRGVDPSFRKDTYDGNDDYAYEACPSYDWYRIPVQDLEERRNKTRPKFDVTQQVFSGVRPIHHQNLNMFMSNKARNERFYQTDPTQLLYTDGACKRNTILPDASCKRSPFRNKYTKSTYQAPPSAETFGEAQRGLPRQTTRMSGDLPARTGNVNSDIALPKLPGKNNIHDTTLIKEQNIINQGINEVRLNRLLDGPYVSDPRNIPRHTKKEDILHNKYNGTINTGNDAPRYVDPHDLPRHTKKEDVVHNRYNGTINTGNEASRYIDPNDRPRHTRKEDIIYNNHNGIINTGNEASRYRDPNDTPRHTRKENTIHNKYNGVVNTGNDAPRYINPNDAPRTTKRQEYTINNHSSTITGDNRGIVNDYDPHKVKHTKREQYTKNNRNGLVTGRVNKNVLIDLQSINLRPTHRYTASIVAGQRKSNIQSINPMTPVFDRTDVSQARETRKQNTMYNTNGNVTGDYIKNTIRGNVQAKTTKKENVRSYIPSGGGDYGADPHYYHPDTLTHNVKKYTNSYKFTDTGAQRFGDGHMPNHKIKENIHEEHYTELENRNKVNPNGISQYTSQYNNVNMMPQFTQKNKKLPEINSRCIAFD